MEYLSKSRVMHGLQCPRQLWWRVAEPAAHELRPTPISEWSIDEAREIADRARVRIPGGVVAAPNGAPRDRVRATQALLESGAPVIFDAGFLADGVYAYVDVLERLDRGFAITAIRSALGVKRTHVQDLAIQMHTLAADGLDVRRAAVMHLNRECFHPDLSQLFTVADVTAEAAEMMVTLPPRLAALAAAMRGPLPEVAIGGHCDEPRPCPFKPRCWPAPLPHGIASLYQSHERLAAIAARGYATIFDLPAGLDLNAIAERQRRAVQTGRIVIEPGLAAALEGFEPPVAYLDFETVDPAIPRWPRSRPYSKTPVQFSAHVEAVDGTRTHFHALASGADDPRVELAPRLVEACRGARTVVAYFATFEAECLESIAQVAPGHAGELRAIAARLRDPLPILREHVYHPDFRGSFSLKSVLNPLVPELSYADLEIRDGAVASVQLKRLLLHGERLDPRERDHLRVALERYVERDTWAMVRLLERLRELAASPS